MWGLLTTVLILSLFGCQFALAQVYLKADGVTSEAYSLINSVFGRRGASEVPDCKHNVTHIWQEFDPDLNRPVFLFSAHVDEDDDRCVKFDRQRTEIRPDPGNLTTTYGDTGSYSWDFKIDAQFQPSLIWTHLAQIKAIGGNDSMPLMTLQAIKLESGEERMVVSHIDAYATNSTNATIFDWADLNEFKGHWVHVRQEATYGWDGSYHIDVTRILDGKVIINVTETNIEMWRLDFEDDLVLHTRPKWGIYRSLNDSPNLRDEIVRFDNFCIGKNGEICL